MSTDTLPPDAGWRTTPPTAAVDRSPRRVYAAFVALLACVGGFIALSSWAQPRPRAAFVSFLAPAPGGPPGFAAADHAAVGRAVLGRTPDDPAASRTVLESRLKALRKGQPAVVYVSAAAACDAAGRVVVLPPDGRPEAPAAGIPLRDILTALAASPADQKLLVLDLCWPADSIPAAVATGVVPAAVAEELDAVPDAGRLTLTACAPGQVPPAADAFGRTPFGYYLETGLAGWAAPAGADAVTVHGLAAFVRARVQRWAEQVSGTRQTPQLYGDADDFPLVPLSGRPPAAPPELPAPADGTDWVRPHWATRDRLRAAGADRLDPLAMRALGAELLAAEVADRAGAATPARRQAVADAVARLTARVERALAVKPFTPPNLAAVASPADPALIAVVRAAVFPPAGAKADEVATATAAAAAKLAAVPPGPAARAVLDVLGEGRTLARDAVLRAADLVAGLKPPPAAVELVFLARLADVARSDAAWDPALAAQALAVVRTGEAAVQPTAFPALQPQLEAAAAERYRGEELLLAGGYVPPAAADAPLAAAAARYAAVRRAQAAAAAADRQVVDALVLLTPTAATFAADPAQAEAWRAATAAVKAVVAAREKLGGASGDALARTAESLERATQRLALRLAPVAAPFRPDAVKQLVATAKRPDATPAALLALDNLLATDLLPADARAEALAARGPLAARLARGAIDADAADGQPAAVVAPTTAPSEDDVRAEHTRAGRAVTALAALADLAGRPLPAEVEKTAEGRGRLAQALFAATAAAPAGLSDDRRDLWQRTAAQPAVGEDDPPALRLAAREEAALRTWLAGWYDHAAATGGPFFVGAAAATRPAGAPATAPPHVSVTGTGELTEATPSIVRVVRVDPPAAVRVVVSPNDWFAAEAAPPEPRGVPVRLTLKAGSAAAPPAGFLVETTADGRPTFARVPVPLDAVRNRLDLLFSQSPSDVVSPVARPAVRPGGAKTTSYLFVRNLGDKPRTLAVELSAGGVLLKQSVTLPAGGVEPVRFPPPAVAPAPAATPAPTPVPTALPELATGLFVRVTENGREVLRREVRPEVRNPTAYASLERAVLIPAGPTTEGRCRLEFQLRGGAGLTVPARVELRLPDRATPPAGTLRGDLPADGELRLFADVPAEPAEGEYRCQIDVDGVPRVYRFRGPAAPPPGPPLTLRQLDAAGVALVPPTGPRGPRLPVRAAVDDPPADATLEVALGRLTAAGLEADAVLRYPTARRVRVGFAPAADGGLLFDADVRDWVAEFDGGQVRGRRVVRARLLSAAGEEIATATAPLVLDDRAPQNVAILNLPKRAQLGSKLTVKAGGTAEVAGVKEVQVFLGKPADGKLPPGAVPFAAAPANADRTVWAADLTLPKDKAGPLDVSVRFVSGTGVDAFATGTLELVDYDPVKSEPGTIVGTVVVGSAPQAGLDVTLTDAKGAVVKQAKTDANGAFKFEGVPPGEYVVRSSRRQSAREKVGSEKAKLPPGGRVSVRIELYIK